MNEHCIYACCITSHLLDVTGVAVVFVMVITTCLVTIVMLVIWQTPWPLVIVFFSIFICVEGLYLTAVVTKVPQGGWLPFAISIVVAIIMASWNNGRQKKFDFESKNMLTKENLGKMLIDIGNFRVPGICFFYSDLLHGVPPIVSHYVRN
jgi:KUP system potassium uptake protein